MFTVLNTTNLLINRQARQQKFVMSWSGRKLNFLAVFVLCLFFKILLLISTSNKVIFNCISCEKHCTKNKKHSFCLSSKHNCENSKQLITAKLAIRLMIANKQEKVEWVKDVTFKWLEQTDLLSPLPHLLWCVHCTAAFYSVVALSLYYNCCMAINVYSSEHSKREQRVRVPSKGSLWFSLKNLL